MVSEICICLVCENNISGHIIEKESGCQSHYYWQCMQCMACLHKWHICKHHLLQWPWSEIGRVYCHFNKCSHPPPVLLSSVQSIESHDCHPVHTVGDVEVNTILGQTDKHDITSVAVDTISQLNSGDELTPYVTVKDVDSHSHVDKEVW